MLFLVLLVSAPNQLLLCVVCTGVIDELYDEIDELEDELAFVDEEDMLVGGGERKKARTAGCQGRCWPPLLSYQHNIPSTIAAA
jgi:hypothetical protein